MGNTITQVHGPVPQWSSKLGPSVEKYLSRLHAPCPSASAGQLSTYDFKERWAYFVQIVSPKVDILSKEALFVQSPGAMFAVPTSCGGLSSVGEKLDERWIVIRRERQTFTRLERTGAIVFTVRTRMGRLESLGLQELNGLRKEVRAWPDDVAKYRRRELWGEVLLGFCDGMCKEG